MSEHRQWMTWKSLVLIPDIFPSNLADNQSHNMTFQQYPWLQVLYSIHSDLKNPDPNTLRHAFPTKQGFLQNPISQPNFVTLVLELERAGTKSHFKGFIVLRFWRRWTRPLRSGSVSVSAIPVARGGGMSNDKMEFLRGRGGDYTDQKRVWTLKHDQLATTCLRGDLRVI